MVMFWCVYLYSGLLLCFNVENIVGICKILLWNCGNVVKIFVLSIFILWVFIICFLVLEVLVCLFSFVVIK